MKRFSIQRAMTYIIPIVLFAAMLAWLLSALSNADDSAKRRELSALKSNVEHGITMCYSIEGAYPESVDYLKENYGLIYDADKYIVHYERFADNIRPVVSVLERRNQS